MSTNLNIVILDESTFGDSDLSSFEKLGTVTTYPSTAPNETLTRIANNNVIITNKVVISKEMMESTPSLKLICIAATGMNNVDLDAAKELNIEVKNVAGYSTDSVIQHTFSMLFYLVGSSGYYDNYVKEGSWQKSPIFTHVEKPFFEVKNKKWGIIGLGEIGRGVAAVASAFGADIQYFSTSGKNDNSDFTKVSFSTLLETSDIITIHAPLNPQTKDLISQSELLQLKDGAILLNLGRGGIVNEDSLARVMEIKNILVGLDVLEVEPMKPNHPLMSITNKENLYITPHIAWSSKEARKKLIASIVNNIRTSF